MIQGFGEVFAKLRTDPENAMDDVQEFVHTDEMLKLFAVIMNDERYTEWLTKKEGGLPRNMRENMREVWDRIEKIGLERGEKIGEERIIALLMRLQKENRQDAMIEAMRSKEVRDRLYKEYQLI